MQDILQPWDWSKFISRRDPTDLRLGDLISGDRISGDLRSEVGESLCVDIFGYPDDEGIGLNLGRPGAALGPDSIRSCLYKMTPDLSRELKRFRDCGDLQVKSPALKNLSVRHDSAAKVVLESLKKQHQALTFGGGNDYAYADGIAFLKAYQGQKPLIINVDAHFDVRPVVNEEFNSGTPFYRLLESGLAFDFLEFGIQGHCNARSHQDYVLKHGGRILRQEDFLNSGVSLLEYSSRAMGDLLIKPRPCFLAIDIDAFCLSACPGASSSWPLGIDPQAFYPVFNTWLKRLDVRVMGIYEVSPPLDVAMATSKWAAQLSHGFLHHV